MEVEMNNSDLDGIVLSGFEATQKTLEDARQFAIEHRDVDALIAISDRWSAITERAYKIKNSHKNNVRVGFTTLEEIDDEAD